MLEVIDKTMDWALERAAESPADLPMQVQKLLSLMEPGVPYTAVQLTAKLGLKSRVSFRKVYLLPALAQGLIAMTIPDKPNSRNQAYVRQ